MQSGPSIAPSGSTVIPVLTVPRGWSRRMTSYIGPSAFGDRQRYPLYMTVFWFPPARISKKTVRNTVNLSAADPDRLARRLLIPFVIQRLMCLAPGFNNASDYLAEF